MIEVEFITRLRQGIHRHSQRQGIHISQDSEEGPEPSSQSVRNQLNNAGKDKTREADLKPEVQKSGFHEKDQGILHRVPARPHTKILLDDPSVNPGIVLHDEMLHRVYWTQSAYHSLYPIIAVVIAFVASESPRLARYRAVYLLWTLSMKKDW